MILIRIKEKATPNDAAFLNRPLFNKLKNHEQIPGPDLFTLPIPARQVLSSTMPASTDQ